MKIIYRIVYFVVLCLLLAACSQSISASTSTMEPIPTLTPYSTLTPTVRIAVAPTPYTEPTLLPTIDPTRVSALLQNSLSIQTLSTFNGHNLQRITGWSYGFNGGLWDHGSSNDNQDYLWMDTNHLLLFPATGETQQPDWSTITARPVVMNINTGKIWLPPIDRSLNIGRWFSIILPRWSPKLQLLVTGENLEQEEGTSTFTADGQRLSHYDGQLVDISPSAERIFVAGNKWIDLGSGKQVVFNWGPGWGLGFGAGMDDKVERWFPIWSRDEGQIYFCCYYYGNAKTGQSFTIANENKIFDSAPFINAHSLRHAYGVWLNDNVVMPEYDGWFYEGPEFSTIFDVSEKTYHNLGVVAGLPDAFNNNTYSYKSISPNADYMFISPGAQSENDPQIYLVDLKTLKSQLYHVDGLDWSANGKYALMGSQVLTLADKTVHTLPFQSDTQTILYSIAEGWHPTNGVRISIYADKQQHLVIDVLDLDALTEHQREFTLPPNFNGRYNPISSEMYISWNPKADHFAFAAADGSVWQVDYPNLDNLEQLTPPMTDVKDIAWSPDGQYLSCVGGTDIYILDVGNNP
jgi:WD40 repeat protein